MPVKDRLGDLQKASKYLQDGKNSEETKIEMTPLNGDKQAPASEFDEFLSIAHDLATNIGKIELNVGKMKVLQSKIFATPVRTERERFQSELGDLVAENKSLGRAAQKVIKEQKEVNERLDGKKGQSSKYRSEMHIRKIQVNTHSKRFLEIWTEFNNLQVEYKDKVKRQLVTNIKITGCNLSDDQIEEKLEKEDMTAFSSILQDTSRAKEDLMAIQNRHEDFIKLEKGIVEIHGMFIEISNLVSYQGEMIDRIDNNIMDAESKTSGAKDDLKKAGELQVSARKKKICLISTAVIVGLILLLIILSELGAFSGSSSDTQIIEHHYHLEGGETIVSDKEIDLKDLPKREAESTTILSTAAVDVDGSGSGDGGDVVDVSGSSLVP
eukprot:TRINITY_DN811_c1_g1_i1.p1 TRINITY_DN811_c1_g1~~TRINITY_DN811_c1_g1_i1.p1  ORF type:complete len:382 (-),score=93.56 TRINITY_DN811_c1_g1_i1:93-1238(-)